MSSDEVGARHAKYELWVVETMERFSRRLDAVKFFGFMKGIASDMSEERKRGHSDDSNRAEIAARPGRRARICRCGLRFVQQVIPFIHLQFRQPHAIWTKAIMVRGRLHPETAFASSLDASELGHPEQGADGVARLDSSGFVNPRGGPLVLALLRRWDPRRSSPAMSWDAGGGDGVRPNFTDASL